MPMDTAKILIVDDQPENLLSLEAVLESPGLQLVQAGSGSDALKHVLDEEFAVILLDVKMPGLDGFETASIIRSRERSRHTPIIFLTAYKSEEELFQGNYAGAVDYLFKPIVPDVLRSKVAVFVDLYKKTQLLKRNAETLEAKNKELERLYETVKHLDELKTNFFANASHELRTPLSLVLGPLENLRAAAPLTEQQLRNLEVIERNSRLLLRRVNDLLDIAKLDAGKMDLDYAECDLARLVALTAANFDVLAQDRRISFTIQTPENLSAQADPEKVL